MGQARRDKNFDKVNKLRGGLRSMGVEVNDNMLCWKGPGGLSGDVMGGIKKGPDDWICPSCEVMVFCSKRKWNDKCFKCGGKKPGSDRDDRGRDGGGRDYGYDRGGDRRQGDR